MAEGWSRGVSRGVRFGGCRSDSAPVRRRLARGDIMINMCVCVRSERGRRHRRRETHRRREHLCLRTGEREGERVRPWRRRLGRRTRRWRFAARRHRRAALDFHVRVYGRLEHVVAQAVHLGHVADLVFPPLEVLLGQRDDLLARLALEVHEAKAEDVVFVAGGFALVREFHEGYGERGPAGLGGAFGGWRGG